MNEAELQSGLSRKTQRVQITMRLLVRGKHFEESASTAVVSPHGCLLLLKSKVAKGDQLSLVNPITTEELSGKVTALGKSDNGSIQAAIRFSKPSPLFWRISFPPDDWRTSDERKR
jgi:hypothetical protein